MPRGNDALDASRELSERYQTTGNAEDLIAAQRADRSGTVRTASKLTLDEQATNELDPESVASEVGTDGKILSAAVRGDYLVYVEELENGTTRKSAVRRNASAEDRQKEQAEAQADSEPLAREAAISNAAVRAAKEAQSGEAENQQKVNEASSQAAEQTREQMKQQAQQQAQQSGAKEEQEKPEVQQAAAPKGTHKR